MPDHAYAPTQCPDCETQQQKIADLRQRLKVNVTALRTLVGLLDELAEDHDDASGTNAS